MDWDKLLKVLPIALNVAREVLNGLERGASNEEIRKRAADPSVLLDAELDKLRGDREDLKDFVRTGK